MTRGTGPRRGPLRHLLARLTDFWRQENALSLFCFFLVLAIFVVNPFVAIGVMGRHLLDSFGALVLISGVVAIAKNRRLAAFAAIIALVSIVSRWWVDAHPSLVMTLWTETWSLAAVIVLTAVVLAHTLKAGAVTFHRIQGSVAVYLLLGLAWAHAYFLVALIHPGAFNTPPAVNGIDEMPQFVYYSFVTLTTVGYGDMTPIHPFARSLATFEAIVGQLYPAILIARLVSLELRDASRR